MNFLRWLKIFINSHIIILSIVLLLIIIVKILISYILVRQKINQTTKFSSEFKKPQEESQSFPKISLLIPAWNEASLIGNCIESLLQLDYPNKELIIIAGGIDKTFEIANKYENSNVRIFKQEIGNKNKALNIGLKNSSGEIIVLSDADCTFPENWLKDISKKFNQEQIKVITGTHRPFEIQLKNSLVKYSYLTGLLGIFNRGKYSNDLTGSNTALRRIVLNNIEGFDETTIIGTDKRLAVRLINNGYLINSYFNLKINTKYETQFLNWIKQRSRYIRNNLIHEKQLNKNYTCILLKYIFNASIGLILILLPIFSIFFWPELIIIWMVLIFYAIMNRISLLLLAVKIEKLKIGKPILLVPIIIFLEYIISIRALFEYMFKKTRTKW